MAAGVRGIYLHLPLCPDAQRLRLSRRGPAASFQVQAEPQTGRGQAGGDWL